MHTASPWSAVPSENGEFHFYGPNPTPGLPELIATFKGPNAKENVSVIEQAPALLADCQRLMSDMAEIWARIETVEDDPKRTLASLRSVLKFIAHYSAMGFETEAMRKALNGRTPPATPVKVAEKPAVKKSAPLRTAEGTTSYLTPLGPPLVLFAPKVPKASPPEPNGKKAQEGEITVMDVYAVADKLQVSASRVRSMIGEGEPTQAKLREVLDNLERIRADLVIGFELRSSIQRAHKLSDRMVKQTIPLDDGRHEIVRMDGDVAEGTEAPLYVRIAGTDGPDGLIGYVNGNLKWRQSDILESAINDFMKLAYCEEETKQYEAAYWTLADDLHLKNGTAIQMIEDARKSGPMTADRWVALAQKLAEKAKETA